MTQPTDAPDERPDRAAPEGAVSPLEPDAPKRAAAEQVVPRRAEDPEEFIKTRVIDRSELDALLAAGGPDQTGDTDAPAESDASEAQQVAAAVAASEAPIEPEAEPQPSGTSLVDEIDKADRKNLGRNSLLMASGTLVSRVLGMVNASLQVAVLGTAVVGDAFTSANTLPNFILVLLSAGILNAVLIPQITKAMKRPDGGQDFVDRLVTVALGLIGLVALVCTLAAALFMQAFTSLTGPALQLAIAFAFICMPQVLFYGIFAVLGNILNARGSFGPYGWAPVANNLVAITGELIFLWRWGRQDDPSAWTPAMIWVLAGTATLGIAVQAIILIPALARTGFHWRPRWGLRGYGFGQLGRFAALTFTALVIAQAGGLLVMKVATYLVAAPTTTDGVFVAGYTSYQRALTLFQVPYSLVAVSLLTALFPQLARAWQRRDDAETGLRDMRELLRRGLTLPMVGIIPASAVLLALALPVIRVIYFSMTVEQAIAAALLLGVMASAMTAYTIVTLQQQYCFATEQGWTNLWMQCLVTGVQVGFALLGYLVPPQFGMIMVCLGMLVGNSLLAVVFVLYARHQIGPYGLRGIFVLYLRLGLASLVGAGAAWFASTMLLGPGFGAEQSWSGFLLAGAVGGVVFVVVFMVVAKLMKITEFFAFVNPILRRLRLPQL